MRTKCNTKMAKLTYIKSVRFSGIQAESLKKLAEYDVDVCRFIRQATLEKIKRDWTMIKSNKEKIKMPF